jgi:membrane-associated phospholipid phosphatase
VLLKRSALCLVSFFLSYHAYAEPDSIRVVSRNTTSIDSIQIRTGFNPPLETVFKKLPVYTLKPAVDIPVIATGTIFTLYATTKIYSKGASTEDQINNLNTGNINGFDRWAVNPYSKSLDKFSYYPFDASFAFPLVMFLFKEDTKKDFWKLSFLYWEAMSVTGLFGAGTPYFADRYRPYAYSSETSMDQRRVQNAKNSAFSGHVEVIATSTFFIAKVYGDYYPETKLVMYGMASVVTGSMAYIRIKGGMHFPSDVLIGASIGALSGILVPEYHKTKLTKAGSLSVLPFSTGALNGLVLTYKFKK